MNGFMRGPLCQQRLAWPTSGCPNFSGSVKQMGNSNPNKTTDVITISWFELFCYQIAPVFAYFVHHSFLNWTLVADNKCILVWFLHMYINPLRANFSSVTIDSQEHFLSFIHTLKRHRVFRSTLKDDSRIHIIIVIAIVADDLATPGVRTQQPWYWPRSSCRIFRSHHQKW